MRREVIGYGPLSVVCLVTQKQNASSLDSGCSVSAKYIQIVGNYEKLPCWAMGYSASLYNYTSVFVKSA